MISGHIYNKKDPIKVWKQLRIKYVAGKKRAIKRFIKAYNKKLTFWKKALKEKLNDPLYSNWHSLRPDPSRLFPYKNTGNLRNSIRAGIKNHITKKGNMSIVAWTEIGMPYAGYTNEGRRHRKSGEEVAWEGWVTDMFTGHGRADLISVSDIFEEMTYERLLF